MTAQPQHTKSKVVIEFLTLNCILINPPLRLQGHCERMGRSNGLARRQVKGV